MDALLFTRSRPYFLASSQLHFHGSEWAVYWEYENVLLCHAVGLVLLKKPVQCFIYCEYYTFYLLRLMVLVNSLIKHKVGDRPGLCTSTIGWRWSCHPMVYVHRNFLWSEFVKPTTHHMVDAMTMWTRDMACLMNINGFCVTYAVGSYSDRMLSF